MEKVNVLCKKLRTDAGLSPKELSETIGVHVSEVHQIENGSVGLSLDIANKYADLFGKKYFDDLARGITRYDCVDIFQDLLAKRNVSKVRFAKAFAVAPSTVYNMCTRGKDGRPYRGVYEEEIPIFANYFKVDESVFRKNKYYVKLASGVQRIITNPVRIVDPDPNAPKPKKTAQMICEEEKKMEYEEALKKAKEYDILLAHVKDLNTQIKKDDQEKSDLIYQIDNLIAEKTDLLKQLGQAKSDYSSLNDSYHDYVDAAMERYENLEEGFNKAVVDLQEAKDIMWTVGLSLIKKMLKEDVFTDFDIHKRE